MIPGSPKAALELVQRAKQDLSELSSPERDLPSARTSSGLPPWPKGSFGGPRSQRSLKSLAASLRKSLSVDIGEHED